MPQLQTIPGELIGQSLQPVLGFTPSAPVSGAPGWTMILDGISAVSPVITAVAAQVIDWSLYGVWNFAMPATTIAFAPVFKNVTPGQTITIFCTQGATSASTWTWTNTTMTTIKFTGGLKAPTASTNAIDQITFFCAAPGVVYGTTDLAMA